MSNLKFLLPLIAAPMLLLGACTSAQVQEAQNACTLKNIAVALDPSLAPTNTLVQEALATACAAASGPLTVTSTVNATTGAVTVTVKDSNGNVLATAS